MKKITLFIALFVSVLSIAQEKITEGSLTQKMSFSTPDEQMNAQLNAMLGSDLSIVTYFKGNKSMSESSTPMTGKSKVIADMNTKKMLVLMDSPMTGKAATITDLDFSDEELKKVKVTPNNKTKTILGYNCKGYDIVTVQQGNEVKMLMFVTDKIDVPSQNTATLGGKIKGFPLYMESYMNQMGMEMTVSMEVTEIKKEKVSDEKFDMTIPEGYQKM